MDIASFYTRVIADEIVSFNVKEKALKSSYEAIDTVYSPSSLKDGATYLDYNSNGNRCAYLYKYAVSHTKVVANSFASLLKQNSVNKGLTQKNDINICCLGGGPGTDIVGICTAFAGYSELYGKVSQATVLDICGGWRNSFTRVISGLKGGLIGGVPKTVFGSRDFKADLIQVNLLETLPSNVEKRLADADIVCMVKFISAVLNHPNFLKALEAINGQIKPGAIVLFVDNLYVECAEVIMKAAFKMNLKIILSPCIKSFKSKFESPHQNLFGQKPYRSGAALAMGWSKENLTNQANDEEGWDTEDENNNLENKITVSVTTSNSQNPHVQKRSRKRKKKTKVKNNIPDASATKSNIQNRHVQKKKEKTNSNVGTSTTNLNFRNVLLNKTVQKNFPEHESDNLPENNHQANKATDFSVDNSCKTVDVASENQTLFTDSKYTVTAVENVPFKDLPNSKNVAVVDENLNSLLVAVSNMVDVAKKLVINDPANKATNSCDDLGVMPENEISVTDESTCTTVRNISLKDVPSSSIRENVDVEKENLNNLLLALSNLVDVTEKFHRVISRKQCGHCCYSN